MVLFWFFKSMRTEFKLTGELVFQLFVFVALHLTCWAFGLARGSLLVRLFFAILLGSRLKLVLIEIVPFVLGPLKRLGFCSRSCPGLPALLNNCWVLNLWRLWTFPWLDDFKVLNMVDLKDD